jgi:hypothetical protein
VCVLCLGVLAALALSACASTTHTAAGADNDGVYVTLGKVSYQLQVSRELNQYSIEDHSYLAGVTAGAPSAQQIWYGVFLWARNSSKQPQPAASSFTITDTQDNVYHPIALNPQINQFAWTNEEIQPDSTEPAPGSTAFSGPTQGGLILFKLPTSVYNNRPLTLHITAPSGQQGMISLNL